MSENKIIQFNPNIPAQFKDWFSASAGLSAEDRQIHDRILAGLCNTVRPRDPFECIHISDLTYNLCRRLYLQRLRESVIRDAHNKQFEQQERVIRQDGERRKFELRRLYEFPPWRRHPSGRDPLEDTKFAMECEINEKKLKLKLTEIDAETDKKLGEVQKLKDGPVDEARWFDLWIDKVERIEKQLEEVEHNIRMAYRLLSEHRAGLGQHLRGVAEEVVDAEYAEAAAPAREGAVEQPELVDGTEVGTVVTEPTTASAVAELPSPTSQQTNGDTPAQSAAPAAAALPRSSPPTEQE
jgi:hypothetical protein